MTRKAPWNAMGHLQANDDGSAWLLARPMNVLRGWPRAMSALWIINKAWTIKSTLQCRYSKRQPETYSSIVAFEALSLPYWNIDGIDAIANACHYA